MGRVSLVFPNRIPATIQHTALAVSLLIWSGLIEGFEKLSQMHCSLADHEQQCPTKDGQSREFYLFLYHLTGDTRWFEGKEIQSTPIDWRSDRNPH